MVIVADGPQTQKGRGTKGVAIVLSAQAVLGWEKAGKTVYGGYGGRVLGLRTVVVDKKKKERGIFLISAYAPVGVAPKAEWDQFFDNLENCIAKKHKSDILLVGADINSSIGRLEEHGEDVQNSPIGRFGLKHCNASGERFRTYLATHNMMAVSTFFSEETLWNLDAS